MNDVISKSLKIKAISPSESMQEAHLFNSFEFLSNKDFNVKGWQLIKKRPVAQIFFYIKDKVAISGYQSTFGSFDVLDHVSVDDLKWFINSLINELKLLEVGKIKIKHYPSYFSNSNLVERALLDLDFENTLTETNQHVMVANPLFEDVADRSEVIRSNKCMKLGYKFKIASLKELRNIYALIKNTLERNGNMPSMTYENLKSTIEACPSNFILFTLWDNETLIAATVSVKINQSIMYNFYHADHLGYRNVSALTFLLKNIYLYCFNHDYKTLDLGISTVNGILNEGLFNFKKARGAVSSSKKYFNLSL